MTETKEADAEMAEVPDQAKYDKSATPEKEEQTTAAEAEVDEEEVKEPAAKRQKIEDEKGKEEGEEDAKTAKVGKSKEATEPNEGTEPIGTDDSGYVRKPGDKAPFTDGEAEQVVAEFMETKNRPFGV